ncbi:pyrroloquinoline quinone biosynthesis protein PqqF [Stutzerimonas zhaodongensis]|uniref:Coenzyme PQQ synthesis protein F n=1 Tax=Stutzerimonas zhaodongensis TaxID=1176257 RepID=A0A3M2HHP7_9GAMM|nr:pyrroloquinoline quinone biosynthesis protein PqqF [Stutzerimonas zhaodongensis]MCQ4315932.1 pyrroloquinoline quinone biosynthesis protein PqqF [Stutzerimonas zhaodongensis]RMH89251.1 pyrroloquinoline quinone biosynthesis protein PqqF [Stutzerimonas zhaodongensis]
MPTSADPAQRPAQLALANGLRVRLLPQRASSQAAALLRVHAGSHDAPTDYPGLAHFLEHLLFLGSRDYPAADGLMPFVQGHGGQLNASTRERHTDFFFQIPARHFEHALLRLLDMLAHPLLDPDAQLREREVLHAEFHARAQDAETLCDAALGRAMAPAHPFSGFHAGNRETLPVEDHAFQQALFGYHRRFYQAGQIELLLAGPQTPEILLQLAELAAAKLPAGRVASPQAPALCKTKDGWLRLQLDSVQPRLLIAFVFDGVREQSPAALDYLGVWVESQAPGGLAQQLREAGLCRSVKLRVPYWYEDQGVAVIEMLPMEKGNDERATLVDAVLDWLRFFSEGAHWPSCWEDYRLIRRRNLQVAEPLAQLRYWVEPWAWGADSDEAGIRQALAAITRQVTDYAPLVLTADATVCPIIDTEGFPLRMAFEAALQPNRIDWEWQQPARNPWLSGEVARHEARGLPTALSWSGPQDKGGQGALFLRWQFTGGLPSSSLWHALAHVIRPSIWAAHQAGVALQFDDVGDAWLLRLEGFAEAIPTILGDIIALFAAPPATAFIEDSRHADNDTLRGDTMLLRQLLDRLPRMLGPAVTTLNSPVQADSAELTKTWQCAIWQGLAVGFAEDMSGPIAHALEALPGRSVLANSAVTNTPHKRWLSVGNQAPRDDTALLLFCPLPAITPECEAAWRVLAKQLEGAFYRRLRSELQLGYAVFSRFSQFGSRTGIVFGVQSPTASAAQILEHIEAFLSSFREKLAEDTAAFSEQLAREAANTHVADEMDLRARASQAWQSLMSGHEIDHPQQVAAAMRALKPHDLTAASEALRRGTGGWVVLSNAAAPNMSWT